MPVSPVVDEDVLPGHPFDPVAPALSARIPLLIGTNTDEAAMFLTEEPAFSREMSLDLARQRLQGPLGGKTGSVLAAYQDLYPELEPYRLLTRVLSDHMLRLPTIRLAERKLAGNAPVFMYQFRYETPVLGGLIHSCHSAELPFIFSTVDRVPFAGDRADRFEMAAIMGGAWASFARTGRPGGGGLPGWAAYDTTQRTTMLLDLEPRTVSRPDEQALDLLADIPSAIFG